MNYNPETFKLELKAIKIAGGEETVRFEAKLYINSKFAATVSNGGTGGCHDWYWQSREWEALYNQHIEYLDKQGKFKFNFEQGDELIDEIIAKREEKNLLKRWCRTQTVFILCDMEEGEYPVIKAKYSPKIKAFLIKKYGDRLKEIVNERFLKK
ncbi:hypothetical protein VF04_04015 [Nostoc linckia z7]|uniref:Uncharacterized protein n=2 Tax=Nostoc linckia TaxID=92942 RepID=A0A9Q5ZG16_NOSLI|nr:hypothetical protein [Nostoc linckia]PHK42882.1 hypothetical protein VF12_00715 [Nostoc linckia z15]PHK48039.1 hypothetical protein VF13_01690 [Nostoc linckia z16]PHJ64959.1 hypothetical protein VF02_11500 [Nostoc linckia z1]PHJ70137.1 hypothetical protein VF05_11660 [Nostoc linckia z3]PHJ75038.1 hypothetical protein VF03_11820 [Nostoc linckia z2]